MPLTSDLRSFSDFANAKHREPLTRTDGSIVDPGVCVSVRYRTRVPVIAAVDQDVTDAGGAHLAEGDFLWVGGHGWRLLLARFDP